MGVVTIQALPLLGNTLTPPPPAPNSTSPPPPPAVSVQITAPQQLGTFTAQSGDKFSLAQLFAVTPPSGGTIQFYNVAQRGGGQLLLNGVATALTQFTPAQFAQLQYQAGAAGSSDDIVLSPITTTGVAGPAVQISASVTGTRSINAANALIQQDSFTFVAQSAAILAPILPNTQPTLTTVGNFTSKASDTFGLSQLFKATPPPNGSIQFYNVALRSTGGGTGQLLLNGVATALTLFTPTQFTQLQYQAGAAGNDDIVVAVQTPTGVSSNAVQITNSVTGTRSVNAANALIQQDAFTFVAQSAAILAPIQPNTAPTISTVGNFTSQANDTFGLSQLFNIQPPSNGTIQFYNVALRSNGGGTGQLLLNGVATALTQFTPTQFAQLQYRAGATGTDDIVAAAQTTTAVSGNALQITNTVSGTRSVNAANALIQQDAFTFVAQTAAILKPIVPNTQPTISTVGNFTSQANDKFSLSQLFSVQPPPNGTIQFYDVALRSSGGGTGQLLLNGVATALTQFTPTQFTQLQYQAGAAGKDDLVVAAQTTNAVASNALQITNTVSGTRSINAANALIQQDAYTLVAQTAAILAPILPNTAPALATVGNFSSQANDTFDLSQLFVARPPPNGTIQFYNVAVRNNAGGTGQLLLNGVATALTQFTPTQFAQLQYKAGAGGSDDIVVAAQTTTGVNSDAFQITNTVNGTRSINASGGLVQQDAYTFVAQISTILVGTGPNQRPTVASPIEVAPPPVTTAQLPGLTGAFQAATPVAAGTTQAYQSLYLNAVGGVHSLSAKPPSSIAQLFEILNPGTANGIGGSLFIGAATQFNFAITAYLQAAQLK